MRLRFVTTTVRSRAASPADSWSASGRAISAPAITTSVDWGQIEIPQPEPGEGRHHGGGQPEIAPGEDDRPPGFLLVGIGAEGEQQTEREQAGQSEDEHRSNEHDHGQDDQHQPSPDPGLSGWRRKYGLRRWREGGERQRASRGCPLVSAGEGGGRGVRNGGHPTDGKAQQHRPGEDLLFRR